MAEQALATAYVNIVPSTKGLGAAISGDLSAASGKAGVESGGTLAKGMSTGFGSSFGGYFKPVLAGMAASFGAIGLVNFTRDMFNSAVEGQKVDATLANITKSMDLFGGATDNVVTRLQDYATNAMKMTGIDDDIIKQGQAKLMTFSNIAGSADEMGGAFDRATGLAMDLSAAGFGSVDSASVMLGKALQDPIAGITSLKRVGVTLSDAQKKQVEDFMAVNDIAGAQKVILDEVSRQVGGTAEASATATGKMSAKWDDMVQNLGTYLMPALAGFADYISMTVIPALEDFGGWVQDNSSWLVPLAASVGLFVAAWGAFSFISAIIPIFQGLAIVLGLVSSAQIGSAAATWAMNFAWLASPITWIILGLVALVAAIVYVATQTTFFQDAWKVMTDVVATAWNWLWTNALKPVFDFIGKAFKVLWDYFINPMITAWLIGFTLVAMAAKWLWDNGIKPALDAIGAAFSFVWRTFIKPFVDMVVGAFKTVGDTAKSIFGAIGGWVSSAFGALVGIVRGPVNGLIDLLNTMISALNSIKIDVPDWVPAIGGQTLGFNIPRIPRLAKGGFVDSPTTALIGEAGPEVVTPLKDFERMMGISGGGKTVNYYAAPNQSLDSEQALADALKRAKVLAAW